MQDLPFKNVKPSLEVSKNLLFTLLKFWLRGFTQPFNTQQMTNSTFFFLFGTETLQIEPFQKVSFHLTLEFILVLLLPAIWEATSSATDLQHSVSSLQN